MKNLIKKSFVILILLVLPASTSAYEFTSKEKEEAAKRTRREIYELYDLYKETVSTPQQPEFGFIGYNGVCSTVTVDGQAVPLEEYVAGVIKHEIGSEHDNPELLKAQAIAARSFLLASKKNSSSCDVGNSQSFQTYSKVDPNNAQDKKFIDAANATAGQVVQRKGEIALTQYQSYPAGKWCTEDSNGWHVTFQRFSDDASSTWTWNGPSKSEVKSANNYPGTEMNYNNAHHWGMSQTIAGYLTRKESYTYDQVIKLFYGESIQTISDGNYTGNIQYVDSAFGRITYFNQNDYGAYSYSANPTDKAKPYGGTIATHGCGPTSVSIVASSMLDGRTVDPIEATQKTCIRKGCTSSGSYNDTLGEVLSKDYNINVRRTSNNQDVINALGTGKSLVIVLMGPGTFTTGGHYIVLTGVNSKGQVSVADPASRKRTEQKWFSFNTIVEQRKTYAKYTIATKG